MNIMRGMSYIKHFALSLMVLLCAVYAHAQDVVFSAGASAPKIGIQDQVQVQYVLKNAQNVQRLDPPAELTDNFDITGGPYQRQSTNMSIVNGKMSQSQSLTMTYTIKPKKKGKFTIPPGIAEDGNGDVYKSNSIKIEVVDGSLAEQYRQQAAARDPFERLRQQRQRQMQAMQQRRQQQYQQQQQQLDDTKVDLDKDLFIKVVVDKSKVYVGEQITASYKLYARLPMNVSISKLPSLNGFWTQDFEMPNNRMKPVEEIIDGQRYQVFTLKKSALFPQQTGTLELDPAEAEGMARITSKTKQRDPFFDDPFFNSFFMDDPLVDQFFSRNAYRDVKVNLKSKPVKIEVMALPEEGKPEHFGAAVGNFDVSAEIDKTEFTTDDVTNLKLTINGSGNLKLIEAPTLDLPNGLMAYDPVIQDTITGRSTTIKGKKVITYSITPQRPGEYEIPAIPFTYFNTQTKEYITKHTEPFKLVVEPGKSYADMPKHVNITDIHSIQTAPLSKLNSGNKPIIHSVGYWSLYALPLFAFIGIVVWKRREDELSKDTTLLRNKRANKVALKRLTTAKKLLQQNDRTPFYEEISKAIWLYLSDKLSIPLSSLSKENVWDALQNRDISKEMQHEVEQVMNECETALYSGTSGSQQMNQTYTEAVNVISKLEQAFKG